jgi:hypothetical protein
MKVRFTRPARADLDRIYAYVSKDNPAEASRLVARLMERAWALGLRYFIVYTITDNEVHITHVRPTSRRRPPGWQR